jgi:hypothetical protein
MLRRISVDMDCKAKGTCQSVWSDDEITEDIVIIGRAVAPGTVPLATGEVAIRVKRQVIADAKIR